MYNIFHFSFAVRISKKILTYTLNNFESWSRYIGTYISSIENYKQTITRNFVIYYISQSEINKSRYIAQTEVNTKTR